MSKNIYLLLAAVVTIVTMGAGCAKQDTTKQTSNDSSVGTPTEQMATFEIKELGIKFSIPAQYKDDLGYEIKPATQNGKMVSMFSKSIMKKEAACDGGSIGFIVKGKQLYTVEGSDTREPVPGHDIKIGDYYITIDGPQDICTYDKDLQKEVLDRTEVLRKAIFSVEGTEESQSDEIGIPYNGRIEPSDTSSTNKSLEEYFATREQFENNDMPKDSRGMNIEPEVLGFIEWADVTVTCPDSLGTPCEGNLLILSKKPLTSGDQEFYLAFTMGTGYTYYGPFTDNLQRIVNERSSLNTIERSN